MRLSVEPNGTDLQFKMHSRRLQTGGDSPFRCYIDRFVRNRAQLAYLEALPASEGSGFTHGAETSSTSSCKANGSADLSLRCSKMLHWADRPFSCQHSSGVRFGLCSNLCCSAKLVLAYFLEILMTPSTSRFCGVASLQLKACAMRNVCCLTHLRETLHL